ncbi:MAG: DUF2891 domain-containing protein [Roseibacillus sp.]
MKLISGWWFPVAVVLLGPVRAEPAGKLDAEKAGTFMDLALAGIDREYPNKPGHVFKSDQDVRSPRKIHPVFYGHFDWHSSVHGHWALVRLLKLFPDHEKSAGVRKVLEARFTEKALRVEADYLGANKSFERMYGWGWALRLGLELRTWDDAQGVEWARRYAPIDAAILKNAREHLPKLDWPIRCGFHPETAFPLAQMLDYARGTRDADLEKLVRERCAAFYGKDVNYPVAYEPSGHDFFSSGLNEADLMRRVLPAAEFDQWLTGFFPGLAKKELGNLLEPVSPKDLEDGHLVHLVGLNLNRAWTMRGVAKVLPNDDARRFVLLEAADRHEAAGLKQVLSGSYEGEHWLGSFAVYLLTGVGE